MDELLDLIFDFTTLKARTDEALTPEEQARLLALMKLIPVPGGATVGTGDDPDGDEGNGYPIQVSTPSGFVPGMLLAVSQAGFRLSLREPIEKNASLALRIVVPLTGLEYVYPCKVQWRQDFVVGVTFDGRPSRARVHAVNAISWQRPLDLRTSPPPRLSSPN
jgi:hypothetical protein